VKNNGNLHHALPTEWFIGECENGCGERSVKWSGKSQQHLCWECLSSWEYKAIAGAIVR